MPDQIRKSGPLGEEEEVSAGEEAGVQRYSRAKKGGTCS